MACTLESGGWTLMKLEALPWLGSGGGELDGSSPGSAGRPPKCMAFMA